MVYCTIGSVRSTQCVGYESPQHKYFNTCSSIHIDNRQLTIDVASHLIPKRKMPTSAPKRCLPLSGKRRDDRGGAEGGTLLPPSHSSTAVSPSPDHPRHLAAEQPAMKQSQKAAGEMRGGGTVTRKRKLPQTHEAADEATSTSCNKAAASAATSQAARDDGASDSVGYDVNRENRREVVDDALINVVGSFEDDNLFQFLPSFEPTSTMARPLIAPLKMIGEFSKHSFFCKCLLPLFFGCIFPEQCRTCFFYSYHVSANTWQDVIGPSGERLDIGTVRLGKQGVTLETRRKFANIEHDNSAQFSHCCPPPREVKAAMKLLLLLPLHHCDDIGTTSDSLMRSISVSSRHLEGQTAKGTRCTLPTRRFIAAFLDMLNFNLTFNEFFPRENWVRKISAGLRDVSARVLSHNHQILVHYLKQLDIERFTEIFPNNRELVGCFQFDKLLRNRRELYNKLRTVGVCTSYQRARSSTKIRTPPLWVHHALLLQHVHPVIGEIIQEGKLPLAPGDGGSISDFIGIVKVQWRFGYGSAANFIRVATWKGSDICPHEDDSENSIYTTEENMPDDYLKGDVVSDEPIRPGDVIEYYSSTVNGRETSGLRRGSVLSVNPEEKFPVVMDSGVTLPGHTEVRRVMKMSGGNLFAHSGIFRPIHLFKLREVKYIR
jgi:hypothetical protein